MLRFLTEHGFEHIAALRGWYELTRAPIDATLGVAAGVHRRRPRRLGARARGAAHRARRVPRARSRDLGEVTGRAAHGAGVRRDRPGLRARGAERRVARSADATIDEEIERRVPRPAAGHAALAPIRGRGEEVRERLRAADADRRRPAASSATTATTTSARRCCADARLGHPRLRGRAGAVARRAPPQALAAARRRRDAALVRLRRRASRDPARRAGARRLGGRGARTRSSTGYLGTVDRRCCRRARPRSSACCRSSSSRRRSTSCATSSTTGPDWVRDPGRRDPAACSRASDSERGRARSIAREHPDPHACSARTRRTAASSCARSARRRTRVARASADGARASSSSAPGDGLFEGVVEDAKLPLRYELEVAYPDGNTFTMRDPYSFAPTLGELDLHLAGEGRHEELYQRLGAHVREIDGVAGTAFAVWAPSARVGLRRRRLQLLGRAAAPDAVAGRQRHLGAVRARASSRARATSTRSARRTASCG